MNNSSPLQLIQPMEESLLIILPFGSDRKKCVIVHSKVIDLLNEWGYKV